MLAAAAIFATPLALVRGDQTWTGTVGNFDDSANWSGGFVPDGNNTILINNGGTAQASGNNGVEGVILGGPGSGTLEVLPGIASQFSVFDTFYAGQSGLGTLSIGSQALVATGDFYAGFAAGANGVVNMDGGYLSPFTVYFGYEGNATITLENGSTLQSTIGYVGYSPGSQGVVNLTNSTWKAEEQGLPVDITVGVQGSGQIQSTGSQISTQNLVLGSGTGSTGLLSASGGTITIEENLQVGNAGTGSLSLTNSGSLSASGISIGALTNSSGTASVTNSSLTSTGNVFVGLSGNGTLVTDGAHIVAPELFVGRNVGSTASATVSGGTTTLSGELHVGADGTGTFTLEGGGALNTDKGNMGFAAGSTGVANVINGHWTATQAIFVGVSGTGTLNIGAQGVIESESGYIAQNAGGVGTVAVSGGTWEMSNTLAVGVNGAGEFSATAGGEVFSQWGQLGLNAGSSGSVTVNNASWTTEQTLTIGVAGDGEFLATNGANVTAGAVELAASVGVTGHLSVVNSTLTTENVIAGSGEGSAEFSGAQLKLLGGSEVVDTLLIEGFAPGAVVIGGGGMTVDTQGGNAQIVSALSGTGGLTKTGAGRLRLTTANTFTGGTSIEGGVLEIANNASLGTGATTLGTAELRATANITLADTNPGSPPSLTIGSSQTATFSATAGNTFTLATAEFTFESGAGLQIGSTGNTGNVVFAPENLSMPSGVAQVTVQTGTLTAGNGRLEQVTALADSTTVASGATLDFQDNLTGAGINALSGAGTVHTGTLSTTTLTVNSGSFAGNIAGSGQLVKETGGTLILSGQNAFIGGTIVNAGTLIVDGDISFGLGAVEVNSGATLGGSGIVGTITLNGGMVAPGSSPGTLTAQNLYWQEGGILFDLGPSQAESDLIDVGGLEGFGPTDYDYAFTFVDEGWEVGETYTLITFVSSDIAIGDFTFTNGGGFAGEFAYNGGALEFTLTAVPEPGAGALIAFAATALGLLRRRRTRG